MPTASVTPLKIDLRLARPQSFLKDSGIIQMVMTGYAANDGADDGTGRRPTSSCQRRCCDCRQWGC